MRLPRFLRSLAMTEREIKYNKKMPEEGSFVLSPQVKTGFIAARSFPWRRAQP